MNYTKKINNFYRLGSIKLEEGKVFNKHYNKQYNKGNNSSYNTNIHNTIQDGRSKYVNVYSSNSVEYKIGDATEETKKWLSASNADYPTSQYPVFRRGPTGAFSYRFYSGKGGADTSTRAVVVCGRRFLMKGEANDN